MGPKKQNKKTEKVFKEQTEKTNNVNTNLQPEPVVQTDTPKEPEEEQTEDDSVPIAGRRRTLSISFGGRITINENDEGRGATIALLTELQASGELQKFKSTSEEFSGPSEMSINEDVITMAVPETSQKIVHCLVGKDLFVDKTWCMVKKADILEDVAIQDSNSPFYHLTQKILSYKPSELLIGYEPFADVANQFMLCVTEAGRDEVLAQLEMLKATYVRRIAQSKQVQPRPWQSQGSEQFVDQFQIKNTRKLISLEWIGDITKRIFALPKFEDCEADQMKNGYTCLLPTNKDKLELIYKKTQETGIQAVAQKEEASIQTDPEIPTNASTQYAPETEIAVPDTDVTQAAIKSQDLNAFFNKYLDYLLECLNYNEVYDLYHDDYPALYVAGEETQVEQLGTYHQYQSFTDVAAIEGKLVISSSWHPNYTGIVAVAYANEIPCLMKELELDSDQTDYEEEKTDEEGEAGEDPDLGRGARDWLIEERREREGACENTELFDRALKKLKEIEAAKIIWDTKIQEETEETRKPAEESDGDRLPDVYEYREYREPEPEPEVKEVPGEEVTTEEGVSDPQDGEEPEEFFGALGVDDTSVSQKSKSSLREQLEADIQEQEYPLELVGSQASSRVHEYDSPVDFHQRMTSSLQLHPEAKRGSELRRSYSETSSRRMAHHHKKHRKNVPHDRERLLPLDQESGATFQSESAASSSASSMARGDTAVRETHHEQEYFDEVTDEEEIKEKQDERPLLELNNPVLVWSFVDDLTPKLRLDSPYEVRVVAFSKHDGNLIAGGTTSGQVVLWDITHKIEQLERPEALTQNQHQFRKRMEDLMNWRRDIRSKRRVRITAITNQSESHLDKVTSLIWCSPNIVVTDNVDIIRNPSAEPNLQLFTCSLFGDLKVWNLRANPMKVDQKKQLQLFKTKERFGRPASLDAGVSPYNRLHCRWKPSISFMTSYKNLPVLLTGMYPHHAAVKYVRVHAKPSGHREVLEDRVQYKAVFENVSDKPLSIYISNLFGEVGTLAWEPLEVRPPDGEIVPHSCRFWDAHHDAPILKVLRHAFIPSVCLTIGGHVFAIWHVANSEEPLLTKRYYGVYLTDGSWSSLRPSLIRIARSDGVVEIWDLIIQSHAPATTIIVSGKVITSLSPPMLPEVRGLLGVADYNSAFRLFFIPQQFRIWTENELVRLRKFINREPERKKKMKEWSKWWRENNINLDREEKKQAEEKKKLDEEERLEKEKQEEARKKYNEEVYKWYMRRRGKPFLWREEAEEKWRLKQEEHMHEMIMAKKKIDRVEMEVLMRPVVGEERNEAQKHGRAQERLKQADHIFRKTVELIFPKSSRRMSVVLQEEVYSEQCLKLIEHYFGDNFKELADEQEEIIKRSPWQFDFEWSELLEKYNTLRMLFNDRRRKRSKTLRWLRKKLREELLKEGRKVHIRKSHTERYPKRKIKRRHENIDWLKNTYGDDYNVYWDKHHPCRRFADRKFRYPVEDTGSSFLGELSEPDVEDEEIPEVLIEGRVKSSLELMTDAGIEFIPEDVFAADLDAALITLESRSSVGEKKIPSLFERTPLTASMGTLPFDVDISELLGLTDDIPSRTHSPQDDSDVSMEIEIREKQVSIIDNQQHELDYIQQSVGTKIDTLQTKKVVSAHKREISEGVQIKVEYSLDGELEEEEDVETGGEEVVEEEDVTGSREGEEDAQRSRDSGSGVLTSLNLDTETDVIHQGDTPQELQGDTPADTDNPPE